MFKSTPQCQAQRCLPKLSRSSVTDIRISDCPITVAYTWVPDAVSLGLTFFLIQANHQVVQALKWLAACLLRWREQKEPLTVPPSRYTLTERDGFRYPLPQEVGIRKEVLSVSD